MSMILSLWNTFSLRFRTRNGLQKLINPHQKIEKCVNFKKHALYVRKVNRIVVSMKKLIWML